MRVEGAQTNQLTSSSVADAKVIVKLYLVIWMAVFLSFLQTPATELLM